MDRVFPRGLMMMDFDEHRLQRRALSVAFKAEPMKAYLSALDAGIAARVAQWRVAPGPMLFYPAMKQLTLNLAATSFLGVGIGPEMNTITAAFVDMVAATIAPIRKPLPGTQMRRGVQGRAQIVAWLSRQVPIRRDQGGDDLFSELCRARTEDGALMSTQAVVDHMSFLMMAAHDTLTSSLSAFVWLLAANPDWQERLRGEIAGLGLPFDQSLPFDRLEAMTLTEMAFKEALRIIPPVPAVPRVTRLRVRGLSHSRRFLGRRQPAVHSSYAGHLAGTEPLRPGALHRCRASGTASICICTIWWGRPYVPGAELRLYAGKMLHPAFAAERHHQHGAGLCNVLEDVADTAAQGRTAGDVDAKVRTTTTCYRRKN
jgi:hypothetical protein